LTIHRIYSLTSIGRPVDLEYRTNRNMAILMAPAALFAAGVAIWQGTSWLQTLGFGLGGALAAFGGWALGRELDPDDGPAAFVSLVACVLVLLFIDPNAAGYYFLVLFTTLGLVRQVNRTTGLEARVSDSLLLLALTLWVVYGTGNPLFALVAGLSFALDGSLSKPLRRQWVFALLSFGATVVYMVDHDMGREVYHIPQNLTQWLAALVAIMCTINILLLRKVSSLTDVGRRPLDVARVRGGMSVALLAIVQGLPTVREVSLLAAAALGVCLAAALRRSFRRSA
jgi:hypothetical protein